MLASKAVLLLIGNPSPWSLLAQRTQVPSPKIMARTDARQLG